jgi:hypothetical protein
VSAAVRRCGGGAQRNSGSAVAAVRWLRRWRHRNIVTSAAAWRRGSTGDDNEDDDDGDGDGAMGSGATGYDDNDDDDGDGATGDGIRQRRQRQWRRTTKTTRSMATARRATARRVIMATTTAMVMGDGR